MPRAFLDLRKVKSNAYNYIVVFKLVNDGLRKTLSGKIKVLCGWMAWWLYNGDNWVNLCANIAINI